MENRIKNVRRTSGYYPNHLTHGLLAAHCATVKELTSTGAKIDSPKFSEENLLFQDFRKLYSLNINEYIKDWRILRIVDVSDTGYLGVIYENEPLQHLIVVHRSTNLESSLKLENRLKQSSLHQDIEGVLVGNITLHQANGYLITAKAVELIQSTHENYSLSFAGHSLGAWLAELSVLYCHDSLDFAYSRAITFDGPGSLEMMQTLRSGDIKGPVSSNKCKLEDLDLISYLTAPNVVNCANKHVGTVYRIFPENTKDVLVKKLPEWCVNIKFLKCLAVKVIKRAHLELLSLGHSLLYILPHFNPESGKPKDYKQVEKWPSITYDSYSKYSSCNLITTTILKKFRSSSPKIPKEMRLDESGINVSDKAIFHWNHTTLDSIAHLALIFFRGKINLQQFWLVHKYLNKDCGFVENPQNDTEDFFLQYKAQYKVSDVDPWSRKKTGDKIDSCLKALETNRHNIQGQLLRKIADMYYYEKYSQMFVIKEHYRNNSITMEYIRDTIKEICRTDVDFKTYINNIDKKRLSGNIGDFIGNAKVEIGSSLDLFSKEDSRIVVIKGMTGRGKTTLALKYAAEHEYDFTLRLILANSKQTFEKSLNECSKSLTMKISVEMIKHDDLTILKDHLNATKQKMLFILDDVNDFRLISSFVDVFGIMKNIKIIITTQNDKLVEEKGIPEISAEYLPIGKARFIVQAKIKSILESFILECKSESEKKYACNAVKLISFVKSGVLSETELSHYLHVTDDTKVSGILKMLRKFSILTVDVKGNICTNEFVQYVALQMSDYESACDLLQFLSSFRSQNLIASSILLKLMAFDLERDQEKIISLQSVLDMDKKCNVQIMINYCLQEENAKLGRKTVDLRNFKFLNRLNTQLVDIIDRKLQPLMTDLADGWAISQKQNSKHEFFTGQKEALIEFLRTFTNFQIRVDHECMKQKAVKEFANGKHVFVIGPTGSGKSTVINFLVGNRLECVQVGRNGAETKINVIPNQNNPVATIGNSLNSQTDSITSYFNKENNIVYWDFPGFFDTRGDIQKIQHAFLLKSFSESLTNSKILLVVESSTISTIRGESFVNLLAKLNQLCPVDKFQNSMSLLVTKCDPFDSEEERETDKRYFLKIFSKLFEGRSRNGMHSGFLKFLKSDNMLRKMALISKVTQRGIIDDVFFHGLNSAIGASQFENIVFGLNFDDDAILKIIHLGDMLNNFAEHIMRDIVNDRINKLQSEIGKENFTKDKLTQIIKFPVLKQFGDMFRYITGDQVQANILHQITDTLKFFHYLNCNSFANIEDWLAPLIQFNSNYDQLIRPAVVDVNEMGIMKIEAPIMSSSDIQEHYNKRKSDIKSIISSSLVFIVDQDLELPGVHLAVSSLEWRVIDRREVRLVGLWGTDSMDSGNFYGYAKNVSGGKVSFFLDGVNGEDGEFDLSKSVQICDCRSEITRLENQMSCIEKLKTFKGLSLESHKEYLKKEEKYSREMVKELETDLKCVGKRLNTRDLSQTKNKDLQRKRQLEKDLEIQSTKLQALDQDVAIIKKVMELIEIRQQLESVPRKYSTIQKAAPAFLNLVLDQKGKVEAEITKEIRKLRHATEEISEFIDAVSGQNSDVKSKFQVLHSALEKAKTIHLSLKDVATKQDKDFCTWQEVAQDAERKLEEKHSVFTDGMELKLSPNELNDILYQKKSEIQVKFESDLKSERKKLNDFMQQIKESKDHIEKFNKLHKQRQEYEALRAKKFKFMVDLQAQLRKTLPEFSVLDERIEQVRETSVRKEKMKKYFEELIGKMDDTGDIEVRNNRELLRPLIEVKFVKNFKKQIANSENKHSQQKCDKLINVLKQHAEIKIKLALLAVKKCSNAVVDQYHLDRELFYHVIDNESSLNTELDNVRTQLKKLCCECNIFSDYINSNVLTDDKLDVAVEMQYEEFENLQKKLNYAKQHQEIMSNAFDKLTKVSEEYKTAKKNYDKWKQNNKSGKAPGLECFVKIYEEFLEIDKKWKKLFEIEAKIAEELLRKPSNLISRKERKWNDRDLGDKTAYVFRELLVYTRQYYEKYSISGSEGFPGSNSGAFQFSGDSAHIGNVSKNPGHGGQHACVLEGIYANEYSFPFLRRIQQKLGDERYGNTHQAKDIILNTVGVLSMVDDVIRLFAGRAVSASVQALSISSYVTMAVSVIASPIIATLWSHWFSGPFKYDRGTAQSGEQGLIDKNLQQQYELNFSQYLQSKLQQDLRSFIFNDPCKKSK